MRFPRRPLYKYLSSEVIDSVDFIIVPSEYQKKLVQSKINNKNIFILGNAVSGNLVYQSQCKFPYHKKIYCMNNNWTSANHGLYHCHSKGFIMWCRNITSPTIHKKIVLWVGRIDPHKNWKLFLKIASELSKLDEKLIFWVVGGLKSRTEEIKEFEEMIKE